METTFHKHKFKELLFKVLRIGFVILCCMIAWFAASCKKQNPVVIPPLPDPGKGAVHFTFSQICGSKTTNYMHANIKVYKNEADTVNTPLFDYSGRDFKDSIPCKYDDTRYYSIVTTTMGTGACLGKVVQREFEFRIIKDSLYKETIKLFTSS